MASVGSTGGCRYPLVSRTNSERYVGNERCQRTSLTCRSLGLNGVVVMRSFWLGEQRRWQSGPRRSYRRGAKKCFVGAKQLQVRASFHDLLQNQVLVSGSVAGLLGQLIKPFTSAVIGKGFNWKLIAKSGGMPSTHAATVTAAATAIGMERGMSDSVFGFAVIFASVVMYDAQGVRRAAGKQAEVINTLVFTQKSGYVSPQSVPATSTPNPSPYAIGVELARDPVKAELAFMEDADASTSEVSKSTAVLNKESSSRLNGTPSLFPRTVEEDSQMNRATVGAQTFLKDAGKLPSVRDGEVTPQEVGNLDGWRHLPLKESVGHTKVEVCVGAVWGIIVSLVLHSSIQ